MTQVLEITALPGGAHLVAAGPACVGLADVAYQRNYLHAALRDTTEGITLCRQFVYTPPLARGLAALAWIRHADGDPGGAREAMAEAVRAAPGPAGLVNSAPVHWARLLRAQGDVSAGARFVLEHDLGPDDEPFYARKSGHPLLARVLLAQARAGPALSLLDRLSAAAVAQGRMGGIIETGALRAMALAAAGDEAEAVAVLAGTLVLARPQGYVRVFAGEGPADGRTAQRAHLGPARRPDGRKGPARLPGPAAACLRRRACPDGPRTRHRRDARPR